MTQWFLITFAAIVLGLLLGRFAANKLASIGIPIAAGDVLKTEVAA